MPMQSLLLRKFQRNCMQQCREFGVVDCPANPSSAFPSRSSKVYIVLANVDCFEHIFGIMYLLYPRYITFSRFFLHHESLSMLVQTYFRLYFIFHLKHQMWVIQVVEEFCWFIF